MALFKVVLQRPIYGKNTDKITLAERVRARRVLIVEAASAEQAEKIVWPSLVHSAGCVALVAVDKLNGNVVVLSP